jgi:hypothetical protein
LESASTVRCIVYYVEVYVYPVQLYPQMVRSGIPSATRSMRPAGQPRTLGISEEGSFGIGMSVARPCMCAHQPPGMHFWQVRNTIIGSSSNTTALLMSCGSECELVYWKAV